MYQMNNSIKNQGFNELQVSKLNNGHAETLLITLETGALFPEHTSSRDANLTVLKGGVKFYINSVVFHLKRYLDFKFPKEAPHWVEALENSKFLIIR